MFSNSISIFYSEMKQFYPKNSIFLDYISSFDKVKTFYEYDYHNLDNISEVLKDCTLSSTNRKELYDVLYPYNTKNNNSVKVIENLNYLLEENCYTIITGQQCGLFTGPLYTIYKAITAILIAEKLSQKGIGKFIPVFWVASEDHDLSEINHIIFPDKQGDLETLSLDLPNHNQSISDVPLKDELDKLINELKAKWPNTEFSNSIFTLLEQEKTKLNDSFVKLMSSLFRDYGLIFVEPHLLRKLSIPINQIAIDKDIEIHNAIKNTSDRLNEFGYHSTLSWDSAINLFYYHQMKRSKLYEENGNYYTQDKEFSISLSELKNKLKNEPNFFSQNVILRPIVQDLIFPNIITVVGPGETSYFAQLKDVYNIFKRKMPIIYPRVSVTLLEKKYQKILNKFNLTVNEILNSDIDDKYSSFFQEFESEQMINQTILNIEKEMSKLTLDAKNKGQNLLESIKPSIRKIDFELHKIKDKYLKRLEENLGISKHQIEKLKNNLIPKLKQQERVFNIFYYNNFYGLNIISELMNNIDITKFAHQVLFYE